MTAAIFSSLQRLVVFQHYAHFLQTERQLNTEILAMPYLSCPLHPILTFKR